MKKMLQRRGLIRDEPDDAEPERQSALDVCMQVGLSRGEFADRQIRVTATWERDRVVLVIRDEGPGFDWRNLPDPTAPENLLVAHGRGVLMARLSVDSLRWNDAGNEVTIVKMRSGLSDSQRVAALTTGFDGDD